MLSPDLLSLRFLLFLPVTLQMLLWVLGIIIMVEVYGIVHASMSTFLTTNCECSKHHNIMVLKCLNLFSVQLVTCKVHLGKHNMCVQLHSTIKLSYRCRAI